jgi:hypothetical protein
MFFTVVENENTNEYVRKCTTEVPIIHVGIQRFIYYPVNDYK